MTNMRQRSRSKLVQLLPSPSDSKPQEQGEPAEKANPHPEAEGEAGVEQSADEDIDAAAAHLMQAFVNDVLTDWRAHGRTAIASVRTERAQDYLKLMTSLFPRESDAKVNGFDELSDEQLGAQLAAVLAQLAAASAVPGT